MMAIMVKSAFKDISINIKTFNFNFFYLAEFIIFFQFGFKGIIVLSGNQWWIGIPVRE